MHARGEFIYDDASERNRRQAWARFYAQREDTIQMAYWAAELAEWLEREAVDLHPTVLELIELVRDALPDGGEHAVRRYVEMLAKAGPIPEEAAGGG